MTDISINITGYAVRKFGKVVGAAGSAHTCNLYISFDDSWIGYAKKLIMYNAKGLNPIEITLGTNYLVDLAGGNFNDYRVSVPGEPCEFAGDIDYCVRGYKDETVDKIAKSVTDTLTVLPSLSDSGVGSSADVTPTQAEQLQVEIDTLLADLSEQAGIATDAAEAATTKAGEAATSAASLAAAVEATGADVSTTTGYTAAALAYRNEAKQFRDEAEAITGGVFLDVVTAANTYETIDNSTDKIATAKSEAISAAGTDATTKANAAETAAKAASVPTGRKVNNKALSSDITLNASDVGAATVFRFTGTLPTTGWTGSTDPYSITIAVTGILDTDKAIIDAVLSATWATALNQDTAWSRIKRIVSGVDSLTFYATAVPTVAVDFQCEVVR